MSEADLVITGALIAVAIAFGLILRWGLRARRAQEAEGQALTVAQLREQLGPKLLDGPLIWGVWQGLLSSREMRLVVRDGEGAPVTEIVRPLRPLNSTPPSFEWAGRRYESVPRGVLSTRSLLRDAQSGEVLFSCEHRAFRLTLFRGDGDELLFALTHLTVFHAHARLMRQGREIGRLLRPHEGVGAPLVLSLRPQAPPLLALCFLLLSLS